MRPTLLQRTAENWSSLAVLTIAASMKLEYSLAPLSTFNPFETIIIHRRGAYDWVKLLTDFSLCVEVLKNIPLEAVEKYTERSRLLLGYPVTITWALEQNLNEVFWIYKVWLHSGQIISRFYDQSLSKKREKQLNFRLQSVLRALTKSVLARLLPT